MLEIGQTAKVNKHIDFGPIKYTDETGVVVQVGLQEYDNPMVYRVEFEDLPTAWFFESEVTLMRQTKHVTYACGCVVDLGGFYESFAPMFCGEHETRITKIA